MLFGRKKKAHYDASLKMLVETGYSEEYISLLKSEIETASGAAEKADGFARLANALLFSGELRAAAAVFAETDIGKVPKESRQALAANYILCLFLLDKFKDADRVYEEYNSYALSDKNQYNEIPLSGAFSVMEVAKAAGYKTFWISNQIKYSAWDTPTVEMASTADHEIWLNSNAGTSILTQYYDEEIAKRIDEINFEKDGNIFLVCHLMGCHASYADRYPEKFEKIEGETPRQMVAQYDNSVYYNDYVLKKIYEAVSRQKNFKAMVYLSDHGEEPEEDKGHEATKFTWQMVRIPLVMFFSDSFVRASGHIFQSLSDNREKYWTHDLLYNALVSIMGIQNVPNSADHLNLASDKYNMERRQLKTLHRQKSLMEDKR